MGSLVIGEWSHKGFMPAEAQKMKVGLPIAACHTIQHQCIYYGGSAFHTAFHTSVSLDKLLDQMETQPRAPVLVSRPYIHLTGGIQHQS